MEYYAVLSLPRSASAQDALQSYRKLALVNHPLRGNGKNFQQLAEAYAVLSDAKLKAIYDLHGHQGLAKGVKGEDEAFNGWSFEGNAEHIFENVFGTCNPFEAIYEKEPPSFGHVFGAMSAMSRYKEAHSRKKENDLVVKLPLTLEELFFGATKKVQIQVSILTKDKQQTTEKKEFRIDVPYGTQSGESFRYAGEGNQSQATDRGDVVFQVQELAHDRFQRKRNDLIFHSRISLADALQGMRVVVKILDERILFIPMMQVISNETVKIVEGEGMSIAGSDQRGNLILTFHVEFPRYLDSKQKKLIAQALQ